MFTNLSKLVASGIVAIGVTHVGALHAAAGDPPAQFASAPTPDPQLENGPGGSSVERRFTIFADDDASPNDWTNAGFTISRKVFAPGVVRNKKGEIIAVMGFTGFGPNACWGESLRSRTNPSVSDVFRKRINELCDPASSHSNIQLAVDLAIDFSIWDPSAATPILKDVFARTVAAELSAEAAREVTEIADNYSRLTIARMNSDDPTATADYELAMKTLSLEYVLWYGSDQLFKVIWLNSYNPKMIAILYDLFDTPSSQYYHPADSHQLEHVISSPLLGVKEFEQAVQRELADKTVIAKYSVTVVGIAEIHYKNGQAFGMSVDKEAAVGTSINVRRCDAAAYALRLADGMEEFDYSWPTQQKDTAIIQDSDALSRCYPTYHPFGMDDAEWPSNFHTTAHIIVKKH